MVKKQVNGGQGSQDFYDKGLKEQNIDDFTGSFFSEQCDFEPFYSRVIAHS